MKDDKIEILCTIYDNDGIVQDRLTFKTERASHYEYMEKCDKALHTWAKDNQTDEEDYYFGMKVITPFH